MLSIGICTHNPKLDLFAKVIHAIAEQSDTAFDVVVVDNASTPALDQSVLAPLLARGIEARLSREERPGLIYARLHAIDATSSDWMLCVDDDNVLARDYVAEGLAYIRAHPEVAAFGGKLLLPEGARVPANVRPFLPFLAVRDLGDEARTGISAKWEIWEPPAAGAFIARGVLHDFAAFVRTHARSAMLGRAPGNLASCEDSLLMHSAYRIGRATAYNPRLRLEHHLDEGRLQQDHLVRLMEGYGRSQAVLDYLLKGSAPTPRYYRTPVHVALTTFVAAARQLTTSALFAYARARYHLAAARAYRELAETAT